jgi:serralysin
MTTFTDRFRTNFDGNGSSFGDLVLFQDDGPAAIWLMNENQRIGVGTNLPNNGPTWHLRAAAEFDFSGTPFSDLLWQNDNGALALWQMQGNTATGAVTIIQQTNLGGGISGRPPVVAANDFLGARSADILFQDSSSGTLTLWEMEGSSLRRIINTQNPGAPWHVVGSGDFDGDGKAGILFRADNGAAAIWESLQPPVDVTAGIAIASFATQVNLQNNGPTWHVKATADFDGDGTSDIVWQNDNGAVAIWLMRAAQTRADGQLNITQNNGPTWHVAAARDMDGDGKADILWQNDNGAMAVWEDFSFTPSGGATAGTANFATQLNINPEPNAPGHADWHLL